MPTPKKYYVPKKVAASTIPSNKIPANVQKAWQAYWSNAANHTAMEAAFKKETALIKINKKKKRAEIKIIENLAASLKRPVTTKEREKVEKKYRRPLLIALRTQQDLLEVAYRSVFTVFPNPTIMNAFAFSYPHDDGIIRPGQTYELRGGGFGNTAGTAILEIGSYTTVQLEVLSWSDKKIKVRLSSLISSLNPYEGGIWVVDSSAKKSNRCPMYFKPIYHHWMSYSKIAASGGLYGSSKNGTFCSGKNLQQHFWVYTVGHKHDGYQGWSELRAPHAGGTSLAQGYHWGASMWETGDCVIIYHVIGPKGLTPHHGMAVQGWTFATVLPLGVDYPSLYFG